MAGIKGKHISEYDSETTSVIKSTCLHLASVLGDLSREVVLVGGMVPYLLIKQEGQPYERQHCGSRDVDLGLSMALLKQDRYDEIAGRLRGAGFEVEEDENHYPILFRWRHQSQKRAVVEFLMGIEGPKGVQKISGDLGAFRMPALSLAFRDVVNISVVGKTLDDAKIERIIPVCGPGAFILLKALALYDRAAIKDAYDIHYVISNYGSGSKDIFKHILPLLDDHYAVEALDKLRQSFENIDSIGPILLARFLMGRSGEDELRADASGLIMQLVRLCDSGQASNSLIVT